MVRQVVPLCYSFKGLGSVVTSDAIRVEIARFPCNDMSFPWVLLFPLAPPEGTDWEVAGLARENKLQDDKDIKRVMRVKV